eukprot:SAG11_NODE_1351_length_5135_cov_2.092931_2_plen_314_part_00
MTCNVMDMLYAWVGQASLGGYIGDVFAAFFSSVISGASGTYMVKITPNQNVRTDLMIEPGQVVVINGDRALPHPPTWGSGGFTVGESASLSLSYMQIYTVIELNEGAAQLTFDGCLLTFSDVLVLQPGLSLTMKSTTITSTKTMLLRDNMHATFLGMDAVFDGNPSKVATVSGASLTARICDAEHKDCSGDLCRIVDCGVGGSCVSPTGSCSCFDGHTIAPATEHYGNSAHSCIPCCSRVEGLAGRGHCECTACIDGTARAGTCNIAIGTHDTCGSCRNACNAGYSGCCDERWCDANRQGWRGSCAPNGMGSC